MSKNANIKQVVLFTGINYIGTVIGITSALFIYPLNFEFSGTVRYVENMAQLLFPIMVLGASHALIKFYPGLSMEKRNQLFNYSLFSIGGIAVAVFIGIVLFSGLINFKDQSLIYFAFPIAVCLAFLELFKKQATDMQKIAVPTLFEKLIPKTALPVLFILLLNEVTGVYTSLLYYTLSYVLILILTALYLFKYFKPGFSYRFKTLFEEVPKKEYFQYSLYSFAGSLGSLLAFRIDGILIPELISKEANGIFGNGATLAATLQIPAVGLFALYAPIISGYLQTGNYKELGQKYKEVGKLLFFIGALLYSCILLGIEDLFLLLPAYDKLKETIPIILILGASVLVNMATSFNSEIITYSRYYRFNMVTILVLILLNVSLNLYFIYYTGMGIVGVAIASFISMTVFNLSKLVFVYKKFGLHPFDAGYLKLLLIFLLTGTLIYFLPETPWGFITLAYKTGLLLLLNIGIVYKMKLVYNVNLWINKFIARM